MEKDVVCGMDVDPGKAAGSFEFQGESYSFCSKSCLEKFRADPARYLHFMNGVTRWEVTSEQDRAKAWAAIENDPASLIGQAVDFVGMNHYQRVVAWDADDGTYLRGAQAADASIG